jgi:hypothetical protein
MFKGVLYVILHARNIDCRGGCKANEESRDSTELHTS